MMTITRRRPILGMRRVESSPRFEAAPTGPPVQATVKWYNPEKGFGFVELATGGDAFLHVSVVERSGNSTVPPGATPGSPDGAGPERHADNRDPECRHNHRAARAAAATTA